MAVGCPKAGTGAGGCFVMTVMRGLPIRKASPSDSAKANHAGVIPFPKKETSFLLFQNLTSAIKALWPKKTTAHVAHFTRTSERNVRFWLAGETRMSVEAVAALLRTDEGYLILEAIMGDSKSEWWITTKNAHALRITRRQIAEAQKRLDAIKAGQRQLDIFQQ